MFVLSSTSVINNLTTDQIAAMSSNQIGALSSTQVPLAATQAAAIETTDVAALNTLGCSCDEHRKAVATLNTDQIAQLEHQPGRCIGHNQIGALTPTRFCTEPNQVGALSSAQIGALNTAQVASGNPVKLVCSHPGHTRRFQHSRAAALVPDQDWWR